MLFSNFSIMSNSRPRSWSWSSAVGNNSGRLDGSSTICAKITARAPASGRRAHHRCSVLGCPCRIDFSRAEALLIASSGRATSISFFAYCSSIVFSKDATVNYRNRRCIWHP